MTADADRQERAGNYVLGLMSQRERERAERDLEVDSDFRAAVLDIAERLQLFDRTVTPDTVPADLWQRIARQIAEMPQMQKAAAGGPATPTASVRRAAPPVWWRPALLAASLMVACGVGYLAGSTLIPREHPVVVVVLDTEAGVPGAIFEAYADDTVRIVPLEDFEVPEGRILQAWTLYDQQVGPVSLGTFPRPQEVRLTASGLPEPVAEQLYEITLEPAPGSPTGRPTGPILVKGFAKKPPA
jgi:anti-sigma-K factor RskA